MEAATRRLVWERAGGFCEYFRIHQRHEYASHHLEHIVAKQHGVSDDLGNLALACQFCNQYKGTNIAGIDPVSNALTPLFHPRRDKWDQHFHLEQGWIVGLTAVGRTTVQLLVMNYSTRVELRGMMEGLDASPP